MKRIIYITLGMTFLMNWSCKQSSTANEKESSKATETLPILVAKAHGFEQWDRVMYIKFTFNVDRDSTHFERSWQWTPKTNEVTHFRENDTIRYQRNSMDSIAMKINAGFVNDKFWLLAPFNLIWDEGNYTYNIVGQATAPISKKPMTKLTVVYGQQGGYTPGDAYDFYLNDNNLIQEWTFRKGNSEEPTLSTTWEGYQNYSGLKLASTYQRGDQSSTLYFDGVEVMARD